MMDKFMLLLNTVKTYNKLHSFLKFIFGINLEK